MTKNRQVLSDIKNTNDKLGHDLDQIYREIATGEIEQDGIHLNGSHLPLLRKLKRFAKKLGKKADRKPSVQEAVRLLSINENTKAVEMLNNLASDKEPNVYFQLGKIYINGVKNKVGIVEFYDPRKALLNLIKARDLNVLEAGYLLGVIYNKYGKIEEAKQVFFINHRNGCIRSSAELLLILQGELNQMEQGSKDALIINTYIQSIKADISS
ncbi:hypothetical protein [Photobacterium damselae]|uniref:hypothetical protein n=1 Tax=Photobacterium damselae TaxID=38293 RepID=UPI001F31C2C8|nr:hypothetical protein [Photobacterium damselae]UKA04707.1 hypothetical protein IHC89_20930 [Photobacterium damselae subsp. damselae]